MASWNLLAVFLAGLATLTIGFDAGFVPVGMPLFNEIGHLTEPAVINVQNPFLRDVFVCMVAAPVFLRLQNRALWIGLARSEERSVGKECGSPCRFRWSPYN